MESRIPNGLVEVFLPAIVWRASQCGWVRIGKTAEGLDVWQKPDGQTMRIRPGVEPLVPMRGARIAPAWIAALSVRRKTEDQGSVGIKGEVHQLAMGKRAVSLLFSLCYVGRGHSDLLYRFGCQVPVGRIAPLLAGAFIHYL